MPEVYKEGRCECTHAPMGVSGLEGFIQGELYKYEFVIPDRPSMGKMYTRVYHTEDYYETCGTTIFKQHFKPID